MITKEFIQKLENELQVTKNEGCYKNERIISSPQAPKIYLSSGKEMINLCANNYLGLANHPSIIKAAKKGLDEYGFGMSSVRFICGTLDLHKELEKLIAEYLEKEDAILFPSCFDANGGVFEALLSSEDAVFSDSLNHASIIDGIRLSKAKRYRYDHNNMKDLEEKLKKETSAKHKLIVTDGVFSMDGTIANLSEITALAEKYNALLLVDDCHATGFIGKHGKGTHEYCDVMESVDLISGTFGKALGGASGGFITGKKEIIDMLRQRARPYLFSNTISPAVVKGSLQATAIAQASDPLRHLLRENSSYFRQKMEAAGFQLLPGNHPIIPVMFHEEPIAFQMANYLLEEGVYATAFSYPVVPKGKARIRTQMCAIHTKKDLDYVVEAFTKARAKLSLEVTL